jgi:hypothetical protein
MTPYEEAAYFLKPLTPKWLKGNIIIADGITPELLLNFAEKMCDRQIKHCLENKNNTETIKNICSLDK